MEKKKILRKRKIFSFGKGFLKENKKILCFGKKKCLHYKKKKKNSCKERENILFWKKKLFTLQTKK